MESALGFRLPGLSLGWTTFKGSEALHMEMNGEFSRGILVSQSFNLSQQEHRHRIPTLWCQSPSGRSECKTQGSGWRFFLVAAHRNTRALDSKSQKKQLHFLSWQVSRSLGG